MLEDIVIILRDAEDPEFSWENLANFDGRCHRWARHLDRAGGPLDDLTRPTNSPDHFDVNLTYLSPTYIGPVLWFLDHAVLQVDILDASGRNTLHRFYVDRAMAGGDDHIFFVWPAQLLYPGSDLEAEYWDRYHQVPIWLDH